MTQIIEQLHTIDTHRQNERVAAALPDPMLYEAIDAIGRESFYAEGTPLHEYVHGRIAALCGDEIPMPNIYVIDSDVVNAAASSENIYVFRGLLDFFEYEEEIDGVLAHELIHYRDKHAQVRNSRSGSLQEQLGMTRVNELRADVEGFALMDKRGVNPRGMISAFERLDAAEQQDKRNTPAWLRHAPTHGTLQDRHINLRQGLWLRDMRSLASTALTPKPAAIQEAVPVPDYAEPSAFNKLRTAEQVAFIRQKARVAASPEDQERLIELQATVLKSTEPTLSDDDTRVISETIVALLSPRTTSQPPEQLQANIAIINKLAAANIDHARTIVTKLCRDALEQSIHEVLPDLLEKGMITYTYRSLVDQFGESHMLERDMLRLVRRDTLTRDQIEDVAEALSLSRESLDSIIYNCVERDDKYKPVVEPGHIEGVVEKVRIVDHVVRSSRMERAEQYFTKPAQLLEHLQRYRTVVQVEANTLEAELAEMVVESNLDDSLERDDSLKTFEFQVWDKTSLAAKRLLAELFSSEPIQREAGYLEEDLAERPRRTFLYDDELDDSYDDDDSTDTGDDFMKSDLMVYPGEFNEILVQIFSNKTPKSLVASLNKAGFTEAERIPMLELVAQITEGASGLDRLRYALLSGSIPLSRRFLRQYIQETSDEELRRISRLSTQEKIDAMELFEQSDWIIDAIKKVQKIIDTYQKSGSVEAKIPTLVDMLKDDLDGSGSGSWVGRKLFVAHLSRCYALKDPEFGDLSVHLAPLFEFMMRYPLVRIESLLHEGGLKPGIAHRIENLQTVLERDAVSITSRLIRQGKALDDLTERQLLGLTLTGLLSTDVETTLALPSACIKVLVSRMPFEAAVAFVFRDLAHLPAYTLSEAIEFLVEEYADSFEHLSTIEQYMQDRIEALVDQNYAKIGIGSVIDTNIVEGYKSMKATRRNYNLKQIEIRNAETTKLLAAIFKTAHEPEDLEDYMFNRWWTANRLSPKTQDAFTIEDYVFLRLRKGPRLEWWLTQDASSNAVPLSEMMDNIYLSNNLARYVALRKILLGSDGVLMSDDGRQELVASLQDTWFRVKDNPEASKTIGAFLQAMIAVNNPEDLYQHLAPVLQELILRPPTRQVERAQIIRKQAEAMLQDLLQRRKISSYDDSDIHNVAARINLLISGARQQSKEHINRSQLRRDVITLTRSAEEDLFRPRELSMTQIALMMGKKAGAIGTRMLQLGGQYYEIPEEDRPEFETIYDQMKGQSRVQAHALLKREATHVPEIAELIDDMTRFGRRIGGGSLVTVFEVETASNGKEVLGIRNPNAAYHVAEIAEMLDRTLLQALEKDPENIDLALTRLLIVDAVDWINREMHDTTFDQKDAVYRGENDTRYGTFRKAKSTYDIWVPDTTPTGSLWVRREAFVEGHNLNGLKEAERTDIASGQITRDDKRQVVSTLVRSFTHQLLKGSYAHSDIHPGNFRITSDNTRIAILDRYNLIEMTPELRSHVKDLLGAFASNDMPRVIDLLVGSASTDFDASSIRDELVEKLSGEDISRGAAQVLVQLKKQGVRIPLEISLLMRNVFALIGMAHESGFASLADAYMHTADEAAVAELLEAYQP